MLIIGTIAWICFLFWLLLMAIPSQQMAREPVGTPTYYAVWILVVGAMLTFHYQFMAYYHHQMLALESDIVALTAFSIVLLLRLLPKKQDEDTHVF